MSPLVYVVALALAGAFLYIVFRRRPNAHRRHELVVRDTLTAKERKDRFDVMHDVREKEIEAKKTPQPWAGEDGGEG